MSFNDLEQGLGSTNVIDADEDSVQYKQLTQRIAQQIFHINGNISSMERLIGLLSGPRDTSETRSSLHDVTEATRDLIKSTTQDLKSLSTYNQNTVNILDNKQIQQKLSKDFQKVATAFQKAQRISANKQRECINQSKDITVRQLDTLHSNEEQQQQQQQQQMQSNALDNEIEYNELLISEREAEIQNIEDGIVELNEIFRNMDLIVNEQESGIQSIYGNILSVAQNTKQAADELMVADRYYRNARRSMCWFMLIITIVGILIALILVIA
ncbi:t-SNARE [Rhizopus microsporus]|uniref:t-SNARE n=1 Tax=Rhizopus microsporus TaxID=58291 RepID=A0A1X0S9P7_RHIZD|nr:t-SNARE [Rhizopus microsporus]